MSFSPGRRSMGRWSASRDDLPQELCAWPIAPVDTVYLSGAVHRGAEAAGRSISRCREKDRKDETTRPPHRVTQENNIFAAWFRMELRKRGLIQPEQREARMLHGRFRGSGLNQT